MHWFSIPVLLTQSGRVQTKTALLMMGGLRVVSWLAWFRLGRGSCLLETEQGDKFLSLVSVRGKTQQGSRCQTALR
jgi:hypothetical protein